MARHIFLIGFMGSGKTHWGKVLAKKLGCTFFDLDSFIEEKAGKTIAEIFAESGEEGFRELERDCLHSLADLPTAIVATGGGTPCFFGNMDWMKGHGVTVYLKMPQEMLLERLKVESGKRPLLTNMGEAELRAFISERLAARAVFYEQADFTLEKTSADEEFLENLLTMASTRQL